MRCVTMKKAIEAPESGMSNEENDISNHQEEELTTLAALRATKNKSSFASDSEFPLSERFTLESAV